MKRKNFLLLIIILTITIISTIGFIGLFNNMKAKKNISNKYLFKGIPYGLSIEEYKEILNELKQSFTITNNKQLESDLIQYFVNLFILSNKGTENGYETDPELLKELNDYGNTILMESAKMHLLKSYIPKKREIKKCYKRSKKEVYVDYIYFNKNQKDLYKATLSNAVAGNDFSKIRLESIFEGKYEKYFFNSKKLIGGSIIDEVEKEAYKMAPGEIKGIKTKNGYFILFVKKIINRKRPEFKYEKQRIKRDLAMERAIFQAKSINKLLYNGKMNVPKENISALNFSFTLLNEKSRSNPVVLSKNEDIIIARAWGNNITIGELLKLIKYLPKHIRYYFYNEETRLQSTIRLLTYKYGLINESNEVVQNISIKKRELVQNYICEVIKNDIYTDQGKDIDSNKLDKSQIKKSLIKLFKSLGKDSTIGLGERLINRAQEHYNIILKKDDSFVLPSFNWLNVAVNFEPQNLLIDTEQVNNLKFKNPYSFGEEEIIASFENKNLKVGNYLDELNSLAVETIKKIIKENTTIQFIHTIMNEPINNKCTINKKLLEEVNNYMKTKCLLSDYEKQHIINDTTTIAYVNNIQFRLKDIKNIIYNYPNWKKKKYLEGGITIDIIKQLIENKLWVDYAYKNNLEKEKKFKAEYDLAHRFLLAQKIYMEKVYCKPLRISDDRLNHIIMKVFKEFELSKLKEILNDYLKNNEFEVNLEAFNLLGYNYDSILHYSYKNNITHALRKFPNVGFVFPVPYYLSTFSDDKLWYIGDYDINELAAYWSFNEGMGKYCYDYSGNGYYGEMLNNTDFSRGISDCYASIDKCDAVLIGKNNFSINSEFTITCWVNISSHGPILFKSSGQNMSNYIWKYTIGSAEKNLVLFLDLISENEDKILVSDTKIYHNKWTQVSATFDGKNIVFYKDGKQMDSIKKSSGFIKNNNAIAIIGNYPSFTNYSYYYDEFYEGFIDELMVFNKALDPSEIYRLFQKEQENYK